nr:iron-containing alcohol dehydrogenase [Clostridia bacterium]
MKLLQVAPTIHEYADFTAFAADFHLGAHDLILTNARYAKYFTGLSCPVICREKYGTAEPTDEMVNAILAERDRIHATTGVERIIAIGGGAIMDMAKVLAVAPHGTQDCNALYGDMANLRRVHELIALPTTCGTGSEVTNISVIFRTPLGTKQGLVGDALYPSHAVLVPQLMETLPWHVFACSAIDALIHAAESYLSPLATPMTDVFGELAMREILTGFAAIAEDPACRASLNGQFLRAATNAGIAFGNAGCGPVHALSFAIGGKYHVPHGESCYQYFLPVLRYYKANSVEVGQSPAEYGKLTRFEALLCEILHADDGLTALADLLERILPRKPMSAYGATQADAEAFAVSTIENQQRLLARAYVPVTLDAARAIEMDCL